MESVPPQDGKARISNVRLLIRAALVLTIIGVCVVFLRPHWTRVMTWGLGDNDDAMRVLQVKDWLLGQAWYDVSQHRLTPVEGGNMHWSRLSDLPLALLMWPAMALFGPELGPHYATFLTPILLCIVYVFVATMTARQLGGKLAMLIAMPMCASASSAMGYFMPGRVDHHGLQIILICATLWGLFSNTARGHVMAGIAIAAGICIGLEALPLQVCIIGWVALRWGLRGRDAQKQTLAFGLGFGLALVALFCATVPPENWVRPVNDAIGRGYVILGCLGAGLLTIAARWMSGNTVFVRLSALGAIALALALVIPLVPEILSPPYKSVDPMLVQLWLRNVNETQPLWDSKPSLFIGHAVFPCLAVIAATAAMIHAPKDKHDQWALAALTVCVAAGLAMFWQVRTVGLAAAVSGIMASCALAQAVERSKGRTILLLALFVNPVTPLMVSAVMNKMSKPESNAIKTGGGDRCYTKASFAGLSGKEPGLVVAPIDMGARILLTTPHRVAAAPYHRNNAGNLAAYNIFLAPSTDAQTLATGLGARYLAICKRSAENSILSKKSPKGLMADLKAGRVPDWLIPIPVAKGSDVRAYEIKNR